MSATLKHGFLFGLAAVSLCLTLAFVLDDSRSSEAADHGDGPFLALDLSVDELVKNLLSDDLKQNLMYSQKFPLAKRDDGAKKVDAKTDGAGLFGVSKGITLNFKNENGRAPLRVKKRPDRLKNLIRQVEMYNNQTPDEDGNGEKKVARETFPALIRNRPGIAQMRINFLRNVPVSGELRARPGLGLRTTNGN